MEQRTGNCHDNDSVIIIKDAPAFDFYPERWSQGTRHMSKVERCDYLDLLNFQWTEQGIPGDLDAVARILGYRRAAQIPAAVLEKFPVGADGKRRNARLEIIRSEQRDRIRKRVERGKMAAGTRWKQQQQQQTADGSVGPHASAMHKHRGPDAYAMLEHRPGDACALLEECPPPTTHHPPQEKERETRARPTLEHAKSAAGQVGVTGQEAEDWWLAREASDWMKGTGGGGTTPIGANWHADLKTYTNAMREDRARRSARAGPPVATRDSANPVSF